MKYYNKNFKDSRGSVYVEIFSTQFSKWNKAAEMPMSRAAAAAMANTYRAAGFKVRIS